MYVYSMYMYVGSMYVCKWEGRYVDMYVCRKVGRYVCMYVAI